MARLLLLLLLVAVAACGGKKSSGSRIHVAAASDLALAFEEVGKAFRASTGIEPVFSFGSTGLLAKQIEEGAPFDVFAAANVEFVDQVVAEGACDGASQALYARGRIVVWSTGEVPAKLADLADPRYETIAIANPDHAPYGRAARQALESAGIWDQVKDRMVYGENVQQAMQYARSGNADVAIVALSLTAIETGGASLTIDLALHPPLDQALVICGRGPGAEAAAKFVAFIASPEGREIMNRYGFLLPGEEPPAKARADKAASPPAPRLEEAAVRATVTAWLDAQNRGDFAAYEALYAERFGGVKRVGARTWTFDRKGWIADRGRMFERPMTITADDIAIQRSGASAIVRLRQTFAQGSFQDTGDKQLVIVETPDGPRIGREEMLHSTVVEGPGSPRATGFAVLTAGQPWLVVADGAGVATRGEPTLTEPAGAFQYAVLQDADGLGAAWGKLIGETVTLFPSRATCTVTGYRVMTLLTPHLGTAAEWSSLPMPRATLARAVLDGGGATYLVADISGCARHDGDVVGVLGAAPEPWVATNSSTVQKNLLDAFRASEPYTRLQGEYADDHGGQGAWTDADDGVISTSVARDPDGTIHAIVGARAGVGCGDFLGELVQLYRVDGEIPTLVGTLSTDGRGDIPMVLVDTNRDGRPEVAGYAALFAWNGTAYAPAYQLDLGFRDGGC